MLLITIFLFSKSTVTQTTFSPSLFHTLQHSLFIQSQMDSNYLLNKKQKKKSLDFY